MDYAVDQPRLTIRSLVDYLTATGAHQRFTLLQNMKSQLGKRFFAPYYQASRRAIRDFHRGDPDALDREVMRLLRAQREALRASETARLENNLRVIADYRDAFSDEALQYIPRRFQPLIIHGVRISTEPTLSGIIPHGKKLIACNVLVDTQADEPDDAEIDYALELLHRGSGLTNPTTAAGAQYWHPSSRGAWILDRPSIRRWRDIQDGVAEIAARWPTISK
ncbi:MAG TPA: hypothetical protein VGF98_09110 [Candidatus Tumulicola sp.]